MTFDGLQPIPRIGIHVMFRILGYHLFVMIFFSVLWCVPICWQWDTFNPCQVLYLGSGADFRCSGQGWGNIFHHSSCLSSFMLQWQAAILLGYSSLDLSLWSRRLWAQSGTLGNAGSQLLHDESPLSFTLPCTHTTPDNSTNEASDPTGWAEAAITGCRLRGSTTRGKHGIHCSFNTL